MRGFAWLLLLSACGFEHGQLGSVRDDAPVDDSRPIDGPKDGMLPESLPAWSDIVIEAEAYTSKADFGTFSWVETTTVAGFSGTSYMQIPGNGTGCPNVNTATCAGLRYSISIPTTGTYYVHARMYAVSTADDSAWWGLDEMPEAAALAPTHDSTWRWETTAATSISAGAHVLGIWHREAGTRVDVVAVTMTPTPPP